jgi:hypothetical protein
MQVATRFLASCPALYWSVAAAPRRRRAAFVCYAVVYTGVGALLFSNFYPWT